MAISDKRLASGLDHAQAIKRGIIRVHHILKNDPGAASEAAKDLFPPLEKQLISRIVARDVPFYDHHLSENQISSINEYSREIGILQQDVAFNDVVARIP